MPSLKDKQANATFVGILFLGVAVDVLLNGKVSADVQGSIFIFFLGAGYLLAYQPKETKRVVKAVADVVIAIIEVFKRIILSFISRVTLTFL